MQTKSFYQTSIVLLFIATLLACKKDKQKQSDDYTVITLAGSTDGFADGSGSAAKFSGPKGIATDAQGNIYVADCINNRIRKITPSGIVSTFAGNGTFGYTDGSGNTVQFLGPRDVATDTQGNVYVTEAFRIRKISPAGNVSTLAGSSTEGFADGPLSSAKFGSLNGIAIDGQANIIYVADYGNQRIRKIISSGMVSTLAGNGTVGFVDGNGTSAQFNGPEGIAIDFHGNVFVADLNNRCIRKITPAGVVSTLASLGQAGAVYGWGPTGVAVDAQDNVFVSGATCQIRKITSSGAVSIIAGGICGNSDGNGSVAQFYGPWGIATDAQGNIYVTDYTDSRIRKISKN
jgi:serine/threonine protein kinase, bacterial